VVVANTLEKECVFNGSKKLKLQKKQLETLQDNMSRTTDSQTVHLKVEHPKARTMSTLNDYNVIDAYLKEKIIPEKVYQSNIRKLHGSTI